MTLYDREIVQVINRENELQFLKSAFGCSSAISFFKIFFFFVVHLGKSKNYIYHGYKLKSSPARRIWELIGNCIHGIIIMMKCPPRVTLVKCYDVYTVEFGK